MVDSLIAAEVTVGVKEFLKGLISSNHSTSASVFGLALFAAFLLLDGFTWFCSEITRHHVCGSSCVVSSVTVFSTATSARGHRYTTSASTDVSFLLW